MEVLLRREEEDILFSRSPPPEVALKIFGSFGETLHVVKGDIRDRESLEQTRRKFGIDRIFHAAVITANQERERRGGNPLRRRSQLPARPYAPPDMGTSRFSAGDPHYGAEKYAQNIRHDRAVLSFNVNISKYSEKSFSSTKLFTAVSISM